MYISFKNGFLVLILCVFDDPKLLELHTNLLQSISGPLNPQEIAQVDLALGCQHTYLKFYKLYMIISCIWICFQVNFLLTQLPQFRVRGSG